MRDQVEGGRKGGREGGEVLRIIVSLSDSTDNHSCQVWYFSIAVTSAWKQKYKEPEI